MDHKKFIQIQVTSHYIYGLDEDGRVWVATLMSDVLTQHWKPLVLSQHAEE